MKNCNRIHIDRNCNIVIEDLFDENYVNIYVIQHTASDGKSTNVLLLREKESDEVKCNLKMDGHYSICKIDVPVNLITSYYYYKDGKFYRNIIEVNIGEIISVNPEVSKLNFLWDNYFSKCNLWKCYVKVCLEIFNSKISFECNTPSVDSSLIYKRDLLNSVINVIDYLVEIELFAEAQRLLDRVTGCNGLCNDEQINTGSCGCMLM